MSIGDDRSTSLANPRWPFEVRYSDEAHTVWRTYSRHRTFAAAQRAYAELRREMPDRWVQMRNDYTGSGILESHFVPKAAAPNPTAPTAPTAAPEEE